MIKKKITKLYYFTNILNDKIKKNIHKFKKDLSIIYYPLENKFDLTTPVIQGVTKKWLGEVYNLRGITTQKRIFNHLGEVADVTLIDNHQPDVAELVQPLVCRLNHCHVNASMGDGLHACHYWLCR